MNAFVDKIISARENPASVEPSANETAKILVRPKFEVRA